MRRKLLQSMVRASSGLTMGEIAQAQEQDPEIAPVFQWLRQGHRPPYNAVSKTSRMTRHLWSHYGQLKLKDGVLHSYGQDKTLLRLVTPQVLRPEILAALLHDAKLGGGHLGIRKTCAKVAERHFWPGWREETERYCIECRECELNKKPTKTPKAPLVPSCEEGPLERVEIDIMGPLPSTRHGYQYVLVACDVFTKYVRAWPLRTQTAAETASVLYNRWMTVHGVPDTIHSDRGGNFESNMFKELLQLMGCGKSRTTSYHPAGNGGVERNNRTIISMIRNYVQKDERSWDEALSAVVASYNASAHESTGFSPHFLLTGRQLRLPCGLGRSRFSRADFNKRQHQEPS